MENKLSIEITKGIENGREFIEHSLAHTQKALKDSTTRHYYEVVDKAILENMPNHILYDLLIKIEDEINRRENV